MSIAYHIFDKRQFVEIMYEVGQLDSFLHIHSDSGIARGETNGHKSFLQIGQEGLARFYPVGSIRHCGVYHHIQSSDDHVFLFNPFLTNELFSTRNSKA